MSPPCPAAAVRAVGCRCARKRSTGRIAPCGPRRSLERQTSRQPMRISGTLWRVTVTGKEAVVTRGSEVLTEKWPAGLLMTD